MAPAIYLERCDGTGHFLWLQPAFALPAVANFRPGHLENAGNVCLHDDIIP